MARRRRTARPNHSQDALAQLDRKIKAGLRTVSRELADSVETCRGYREIIQAVEAQNLLLFSYNTGKGLKNNRATQRIAAQNLTILLQLVHNAYALGVQGKGLEDEEDKPDSV